MIALHEREQYPCAVERRADAENSAAYPTPDDQLVAVAADIRDQLALEERYGLNVKQQEFIEVLIPNDGRTGAETPK